MSLTIYQMAHSPYCIPITQALTALGIPFKTVEVSNGTRKELLPVTKGRYYQVPVLKDGIRVITESSPHSQDIARYIGRKYARRKLFPKELEGIQRIVIRHIEDEIEAVTFRLVDPRYIKTIKDASDRAMTIRHKERKFGVGCVDMWHRRAAELRQQADALLADFDDTLRLRDFILGDTPVYGDFALYGILGNYTYKGWNKLNPRHAALKRWFARMADFRFS